MFASGPTVLAVTIIETKPRQYRPRDQAGTSREEREQKSRKTGYIHEAFKGAKATSDAALNTGNTGITHDNATEMRQRHSKR